MSPEMESAVRDAMETVIIAAVRPMLSPDCGVAISKIQLFLQGGGLIQPEPTSTDGDPASTGAMLAAYVLAAWGFRAKDT